MIIPVRCFTCNSLIANKYMRQDKTGYVDLLKQGHTPVEAFAKLNINNMCCRRMILGHVDMVSKLNL
jgi:DNA-directed RNA polymerase I, II, and III subunit RPABC5